MSLGDVGLHLRRELVFVLRRELDPAALARRADRHAVQRNGREAGSRWGLERPPGERQRRFEAGTSRYAITSATAARV